MKRIILVIFVLSMPGPTVHTAQYCSVERCINFDFSSCELKLKFAQPSCQEFLEEGKFDQFALLSEDKKLTRSK